MWRRCRENLIVSLDKRGFKSCCTHDRINESVWIYVLVRLLFGVDQVHLVAVIGWD